MRTRAAILPGVGEKWVVDEVELGSPGPNDVIVEVKAAGLCHSEEHMATGDMVFTPQVRAALGMPEQFPLIGGHEGAGVVVEVGSDVRRVKVGDHVATSFIPSCGICPPCVSGRQYLCDQGFDLMTTQAEPRHFWRGAPTNTYSNLGTFAEHALVHENSVVKVEDHHSFEHATLVSCGVPTGWGSAVDRAGTQPGDVVAVIGIGGIGVNAVQGARAVGARVVVAIDPVAFKRQKAAEFGATHTAASVEEALPLIQQFSRGRLCDRVIVTPSVLHGEILAAALSITGKGATCVATAVAPYSQDQVPLALADLTLWNKELKGTIYGSTNPRAQIPKLLALHESGQLRLDELISHRYRLDDINAGYEDLRDGKVLRGVITF